MQRTIPLPKAYRTTAQSDIETMVVRAAPSVVATPSPRLVDVWRETAEMLGTHAVPLLLLGVIGFAAASLINSPLAVITFPLTRAAMMHIVLRDKLHGKWLRQLPVLLIIAWVYLAAITTGEIGVGVSLRAWGFNLNFAEQASLTWQTASQTVLLRSVDAALLTPESPAKGWLQGWRNWVFEEWVQKLNDDFEHQLQADYWRNGPSDSDAGSVELQAKDHKASRTDIPLLFAVGLLLIFVAEPLFAFRALMGVKPMQTLWLSLRHFGTLAGHLWLLRLVLVCLKAAFVFAPMVVVDRMSYLAHGWGWFGSSVQVTSLSICLAVINAFCMTFEAVYTARLYSSCAIQMSRCLPAN